MTNDLTVCEGMQPKAIDWASKLFPDDPAMAEMVADSMRDYANTAMGWIHVEIAARMRNKYPASYHECAFIGDGQEQRLFGAGVSSGVDRMCQVLLCERRELCIYVLPERCGTEPQHSTTTETER